MLGISASFFGNTGIEEITHLYDNSLNPDMIQMSLQFFSSLFNGLNESIFSGPLPWAFAQYSHSVYIYGFTGYTTHVDDERVRDNGNQTFAFIYLFVPTHEEGEFIEKLINTNRKEVKAYFDEWAEQYRTKDVVTIKKRDLERISDFIMGLEVQESDITTVLQNGSLTYKTFNSLYDILQALKKKITISILYDQMDLQLAVLIKSVYNFLLSKPIKVIKESPALTDIRIKSERLSINILKVSPDVKLDKTSSGVLFYVSDVFPTELADSTFEGTGTSVFFILSNEKNSEKIGSFFNAKVFSGRTMGFFDFKDERGIEFGLMDFFKKIITGLKDK